MAIDGNGTGATWAAARYAPTPATASATPAEGEGGVAPASGSGARPNAAVYSAAEARGLWGAGALMPDDSIGVDAGATPGARRRGRPGASRAGVWSLHPGRRASPSPGAAGPTRRAAPAATAPWSRPAAPTSGRPRRGRVSASP